MGTPRVTFVVPCFNLGHLLTECVNSILAQSFRDLEILVMDDCSPDDTPAVARSFRDHRVKHVRNEPNLGHLRNYNKGIGLARGEYIWLISADDRLRSSTVLERFVAVLDKNPGIGYVFCPPNVVVDGADSGVPDWAFYQPSDATLSGHALFEQLLEHNCIAAPSGLVRRDCYQLSVFPLDLPFAGDWYLWCLFALHHQVGYLAEPMVDYRVHAASITSYRFGPNARLRNADDFAVRWRIMQAAERVGNTDVAARCEDVMVRDYATRLGHRSMELADFEASVAREAPTEARGWRIRAQVYDRLGHDLTNLADGLYAAGERTAALTYYRVVAGRRFAPKAWAKYALLRLGGPGDRLRGLLSSIQRRRLGSGENGAS
jgi:glycosyltransferase involved in cell wall biosynthesis